MIAFRVVALPIGIFIEGMTISYLWLWFIVPTFGLPAITIVQAIGISLCYSVLEPLPTSFFALLEKEKEGKEEKEKFSAVISIINWIKALSLLVIGWVVKSLFII